MVFPLLTDLVTGNGQWPVFLESAVITAVMGGLLALACANSVGERLSVQQLFFLAAGVWAVLPVFGAIPFMLGATQSSFADAYFEAMSGLTTTGSTVLSGLDDLPRGLLFWRSMLQWFGGIGIIIVAMVFLPELRVGGMQIFRSEAFETGEKVLPRAAEIAARISGIYIGLTFANVIAYLMAGMSGFDAVNHAMTTMSTGGFSTYDASFGTFQGPAEYVAAVFMVLASLPFVRYVQFVTGTAKPLLRDTQVHAFIATMSVLILLLTLYRIFINLDHPESSFREAVFNVTSIMTGTGYASVDYQMWGGFPVVVFFFLGLIGGCAGSTCCSVKIFRYQILLSAIRSQIRRIHSPHAVARPHYDGRPVGEEVLSSVMVFFVAFILTLGIVTVLLSMTGLDFVTSVSGAATAVANIGPGLGEVIGPSGNFSSLSDTAKWILSFTMLAGRLELMVVFVLFTPRFWRT